jgi:hypothetical protein
MEFDTPLRFLARTYYKAPPKVQSTSLMSALSQALGVSEFNMEAVTGIDIPSGLRHKGTRLVALPWILTMSHESIDLEQHFQPGTPANYSEFAEKAASVFEIVANSASDSAIRVACVHEGLISSRDSSSLAKLGNRLLNPPKLLENPFEWDWRCATKVDRDVGGKSEVTNVVATVKRTSGSVAGQAFDGIFVSLDVNTAPENALPRFEGDRIKHFFVESNSWFSELGNSIAAIIGDA